MGVQLRTVLAHLIRDISAHRQRTGELADVRGFWSWQPVWVPRLMPAVIVDQRPLAERL